MIPESSQSGKTYIYEAKNFPKNWKIVTEVMKNVPMIDPSIIKHQKRWWLFYSLPGPNGRAMKELHIAFSDDFLSILERASKKSSNKLILRIVVLVELLLLLII